MSKPLFTTGAGTDRRCIYEHPLNERIRLFLRLEWLFLHNRDLSQVSGTGALHARIGHLLDLGILLQRGDIRKEILREFERVQLTWSQLRALPHLDPKRLDRLLAEFSQKTRALLDPQERVGEGLKNCELLNLIKSKAVLPGGATDFDVPAYGRFIQLEPTARQATLDAWYGELAPIESAIHFYLKLLRESADFTDRVAPNGGFEQDLTPLATMSLIRIALDPGCAYFPEVSANRHRLFIRFLTQPNLCERPTAVKTAVHWQIQHCQI
ncbi:MAG: cell division protein ZapD [Gammaproteobacteria bacterium]